MMIPRLNNHGILREVDVKNGKVVFEGTDGSAEFEGGGSSTGLPSGGTNGQVLTKTGENPEDMAWANINLPQVFPRLSIAVNGIDWNNDGVNQSANLNCATRSSDSLGGFAVPVGYNAFDVTLPCYVRVLVSGSRYIYAPGSLFLRRKGSSGNFTLDAYVTFSGMLAENSADDLKEIKGTMYCSGLSYEDAINGQYAWLINYVTTTYPYNE